MKTRLLSSGGILLTLLGLAAAASAQTISSAANQTFVVADPSTAASSIKVVDQKLKVATDIRIQIPATLAMVWDTTIHTVTITGRAAAKVSTTLLPYESGNKVVVVDVLQNFAPGDTVIISGLAFTSFTAASGPASLGLVEKPGGPVVATDNRTKTIAAKVYAVSVSPHGTTASQLPSNGINYTVAFTVTNTGNGLTSYDLLTAKRPGTVLATISIAGPGITQGGNPDSARLTSLLAGGSAIATVTYSVAMAASGTKDTLVFKARAVLSPATADTGKLTLTVVRPTMTVAKSVSPGGTQLPGANLTYTVTLTNIGSSNAASVVVVDTLPPAVQFKVGSIVNTLPAGVSVVVAYSNNGGATWTYVPTSGGCGAVAGYDGCVNRVRWSLQNPFSSAAPNNTGTLQLVTQIR
jgi:uncharacterized repeat protein (TIGR01451 family)